MHTGLWFRWCFHDVGDAEKSSPCYLQSQPIFSFGFLPSQKSNLRFLRQHWGYIGS